MSESDSTERDALNKAIEEHPEEVAEFVDRLDLVNELLTVVELGMAAADDDMVVSIAGLGDSLGELADTAAEPETARGLRTVLGAVGEVEADESTPKRMGPVALAGALQDDDVQMGIGYLLEVARVLGRNVSEQKPEERQ